MHISADTTARPVGYNNSLPSFCHTRLVLHTLEKTTARLSKAHEAPSGLIDSTVLLSKSSKVVGVVDDDIPNVGVLVCRIIVGVGRHWRFLVVIELPAALDLEEVLLKEQKKKKNVRVNGIRKWEGPGNGVIPQKVDVVERWEIPRMTARRGNTLES